MSESVVDYTTIEDLYQPLSPSFRVDPYPDLHRLRQLDPVHWSRTGYCWVLSRYNDIKQVLGDKRFAIGLDQLMQIEALKPVFAEPYNQIIRTQLLGSDPPGHTRIRAVLAKAVTPPKLDALRVVSERIVADLIAQARAQGGLDLIADFAHPLPFRVICEILSIPDAERAPLVHWTHAMMRPTDPMPMTPAETAVINAVAFGFRDFFLDMVRRDRVQPGDGFFHDLVVALDEGKLNEEELVANLILLFCAGHDTVINLFGNGMLALFRHPRQMQILQDDPTLIRGAIEELLRYDTSVTIARRTAMEPVEVGGRQIARGAYVLCLLNAGNRDPEIFPDPDRLDVRRPNVKPLSFGGGIHYCLGAQLARLEGEVGIHALLTQLPGLEPETLEPPWKQNVFVRGVAALRAVCTQA